MNKSPRVKDRLINKVAHTAMDWIGSIPSLIVHTILFVGSFSLVLAGFDINQILLVVTTLVSLEAIYLAIFIQMAVNENSQSLDAVEEDIDEIQEDVEEIQKDIDEIEKDVDEIQKDVDVLEKSDVTEGKEKLLDTMEKRLVKLTSQVEKMKSNLK